MTAVRHSYILDVSRDSAAESSPLAWKLFLLLNATLFLRPAEIVPQLEGLPIYNAIIVVCLALSLRPLARQFRPAVLASNPITLCVFGMLLAIVLSRLVRGDTWYARKYGTEFAKVILYYLLLVSLVDSPRRLRHFLMAIAVFALCLTGVSLLKYYGIIDLATVAPLEQTQPEIDPATGDLVIVRRLQAAGIYANPNDIARIIVVGITVCLFAMTRRGASRARWLWAAPLAVFLHALRLTYSRGGFLALLAGMLVLFYARYGTKKGTLLALVLLPGVLLFSGRQSNISVNEGTGQLRIQMWSNGLVAMRSSPIFGTGADTYFKLSGNHAHNSFIEAFVETGLFGGVLYTGAFYLAATGLYRLKSEEMKRVDPELWRMRPYLLSLIVGTVVGQLSSSREYSLPTYMILGVVTAYFSLAARRNPGSVVRMSPQLAAKVALVGVATLLAFHFYTKATAHFGG